MNKKIIDLEQIEQQMKLTHIVVASDKLSVSVVGLQEDKNELAAYNSSVFSIYFNSKGELIAEEDCDGYYKTELNVDDIVKLTDWLTKAKERLQNV